jgi:hypothetical protein
VQLAATRGFDKQGRGVLGVHVSNAGPDAVDRPQLVASVSGVQDNDWSCPLAIRWPAGVGPAPWQGWQGGATSCLLNTIQAGASADYVLVLPGSYLNDPVRLRVDGEGVDENQANNDLTLAPTTPLRVQASMGRKTLGVRVTARTTGSVLVRRFVNRRLVGKWLSFKKPGTQLLSFSNSKRRAWSVSAILHTKDAPELRVNARKG